MIIKPAAIAAQPIGVATMVEVMDLMAVICVASEAPLLHGY